MLNNKSHVPREETYRQLALPNRHNFHENTQDKMYGRKPCKIRVFDYPHCRLTFTVQGIPHIVNKYGEKMGREHSTLSNTRGQLDEVGIT